MKVFKIGFNGYHNFASECYAKIEKIKDTTVVILIHTKIGTSVTNFFENLATLIYHEILEEKQVDKIVWINYVADNTYDSVSGFCEKVDLDFKNNVFSNPKWDGVLKDEEIINFLKDFKSNESTLEENLSDEVILTSSYKDYYQE